MPKISVLMSVYKEPLEWVAEAIDSILNQTFTDFEYIIVNDNPESAELQTFLDDYAKKDARIKIFTNEQNIGLTKSLNIGLAQCTGEYIARMDADDISLPQRFEKQVEFMDSNPDLIASSALAYAWDGSKILSKIYRPISCDEIISYTFTSSPFIHPLLIIRRNILIENNLSYDDRFNRSQDYKLAIDLLEVGQIKNISEYLLNYRISKNQITSQFGNEQVELSKLIRRDYISRFYRRHGFGNLDKDITINTIIQCNQLERYYLLNATQDIQDIKVFKRAMNSIRRLFYYSLIKYSYKSLINFLISFDYFRYPYNIRRFGVIVSKHFKSDIIYKLL